MPELQKIELGGWQKYHFYVGACTSDVNTLARLCEDAGTRLSAAM